MEIKIKSRDDNVSSGLGYLLYQHNINNMLGKVLTLVETLGLKESQEKSMKELVKQEIWNSVEGSVIPEKLSSVAADMCYSLREDDRAGWLYREGDYELTFTKDDAKDSGNIGSAKTQG